METPGELPIGTDRPPMVPLISRQPEFLFATDVEASQYAANHALVGQLWDSLRCWMSHIDEMEDRQRALIERFDSCEHLSLVEIYEGMTMCEKDASFYQHFERDEIKACIKVLALVQEGPVKHDLERLQERLQALEKLHREATNGMLYVGNCVQLLESTSGDRVASVTEEGVWAMADCSDTLPPMFSSLRALWVCCTLFGATNPGRFTAIIKWVVHRVERSIHDACHNVIDRMLAWPKSANTLKEILVGGQDACVSVQEEFHQLRQQLSESGVLLGSGYEANAPDAVQLHTVFFDLDDDVLFVEIEWFFHRLTLTLQAVDALQADLDKLGSALTDPITNIDLMDPYKIDNNRMMAIVARIENEAPPNPDTIIERIGMKQQKKQTAAPRKPFDQLTKSLVVNVEFNPPMICIVGGPLSEGGMNALINALPQCCDQTNVVSGRFLPPKWQHPAEDIAKFTIDHQYCESEISQTFFLATLLDVIESEVAWKMTDTHAHMETEDLVRYMLHFRRHRSKKANPELLAIDGPSSGVASETAAIAAPTTSP